MNRSDDLFPPPGGTPDPRWHRVFDEASDTPPVRVWDGVERQLDLDEADGILPLWQHQQGRQSMLFGRWAAGIAASLLLTALGWWAWHREDALRPDRAVAVAPKPVETSSSGTLVPVDPVAARARATKVYPIPAPRLADASFTARRPVDAGTFIQPEPIADVGTLVAREPVIEPTEKTTRNPQEVNGTLIFTETRTITTYHLSGTLPFQSGVAGFQLAEVSRPAITRFPTSQSFNTQLMGGQQIDGQYVNRSVLLTPSQAGQSPPDLLSGTRWPATPVPGRSAVAAALPQANRADARSATESLTPQPKSSDLLAEAETAQPASTPAKKRRPWLSAGVMASAFNPAVAVRSVFNPVAIATQSSVPVNVVPGPTPNVQSGVGRGVSFQAGIGIPLGEHWSVETGVGYLSGRNDIQSPARISSLTSSQKAATTDNLYTDLLTRSIGQPVVANGAADRLYAWPVANQGGNYTSAEQQVVSNLYEFVQVPVQVGYELRPRRKFGLALLTGLVSNWFVRNTVAETIAVKAGDGVYRPVTMAGTAGMRLRYRPDTNWSASVAGTFQQSLQSLTRNEVGLQANPQQVGLSFSVDRHF